METDEAPGGLPFQLEFDKPIPFQIKIAEWNPEKDLLAVVTEDSKILLHRFNWQRLWMISHGSCITSLCWRPDGKVVAVGIEDGTIYLHDVENGKVLRSMKSHTAAIVCLNWEEDGQVDCNRNPVYEDRTSRFFPPPPQAPQMPILVSGDDSLMIETDDSFRELSNLSHQSFNILCSGDEAGSICFTIFGIFQIAKVNIHDFSNCIPYRGNPYASRLQNVLINKVSLSKDLCHLTIMCSGELADGDIDLEDEKVYVHGSHGLYCLVLDTSIFLDRKNELHQVAQQASSIADLTEVIRASLSVMLKHWSDAMKAFHQKFDSLSSLIIDHGLDSSPREEFLRLLGGLRASPPVHQFLVNSLGELGVRRLSKLVCSTGKDLQEVVHNHLQPAADIIGFRIGELRGLSKWRARYECIGLDETLLDDATEKAGMLIVQVVRFLKILSSVVQQFSNFFIWLQKSTKLLMSERSDHLQPFSSELAVIFMMFLYDQDPVRLLLEISDVQYNVDIDKETVQRVQELVVFGGFSDTDYLRRTLAKQFQLMESCLKETFLMPFTTVSKKIIYKNLLPLFPLQSLTVSAPLIVPTSVSYYKDDVSKDGSVHQTCKHRFLDYMCFKIPDESLSCIRNCIGVVRGFMSSTKERDTSMEATLLCLPDGFTCADLSLYKDNQLAVLLNEVSTDYEDSENAHFMILRMSDVWFTPVLKPTSSRQWLMHEIQDSIIHLQMENERVRGIPHSVVAPLAVSASRGVACIFSARTRALVYNLEEDEEDLYDDQ